MEYRNLGRRSDKHIDELELNALVPSSCETGQELRKLPPHAVHEAERHVESCADCSRKVLQYRQLVARLSGTAVSKAAQPASDCPKDEHVDWHEVAAGLWPELKSKQLIMHAALCDHCGPLLRAATSVSDEPTPQEEKLLSELKVPSRPVPKVKPEPIPRDFGPLPIRRQLLHWKIVAPVSVLMLTVVVLNTRPSSSRTPLSGAQFAEFAVGTHRQHAQGSLALDVRSDSQQKLNEWFTTNSPFALALPTSPTAVPDEDRPYRLEGARLLPVAGKSAAFIAYQMPTAQMQTATVSLMVTPDSVAVASGGVEVDFSKVRFHYAIVQGYKVVTWSLHGLTYALVSQEGNSTQRSCMVCHFPMRDRDLSQTKTPLLEQ